MSSDRSEAWVQGVDPKPENWDIFYYFFFKSHPAQQNYTLCIHVVYLQGAQDLIKIVGKDEV